MKYDYRRWAISKTMVIIANSLVWVGILVMIFVPPFLMGTRWEDYRLFMALPAIVAAAVQKQVKWYHWVCPACGVQLPVNKSPRKLRNCPRCQVKLYKPAEQDQKSA